MEKMKDKSLKLIQFYATWCAPCRALAPVMESVSKKMADRVEVSRIDVESDSSLVREFQVRAVPTMILLRDNTLVWKHMGTIFESDLLAVLDTYLKENK